jgi:NitT/TauT family transport system substrate-binding protein
MVALAAALADALNALHGMSGQQLAAALPKEMTTGLDLKEFGDILGNRRDALYPQTVKIDVDAGERVAQSLVAGGLIKPGANIAALYDTSIAGG